MISCLSRSRILTWKDLLEGRQPSQPIAQADQPPLSIYYIVDLLYSYMPTGKLFGVVYNPHFNIYLLLLLSYPLTCFNYSRDERGGAGWLLNRITWSHDEDKYSRWAVERYPWIFSPSSLTHSLAYFLSFICQHSYLSKTRAEHTGTPLGGPADCLTGGLGLPGCLTTTLARSQTGFLANLRKQFSKIQKNSTQSY